MRSVYDTDGLGRMSSGVLAAADAPAGCTSQIAMTAPTDPADTRSQVADLVKMKDPANAAYGCAPARFIRAVRAIAPDKVNELVVRGQYMAGAIAGKPVPGYREEKDVATNSQTDTFTALKLYFDNWRWADVPFYLRSAKRMPKRVTDIAITFRKAPLQLFKSVQQEMEPNVLVIRV